MKPKEAERSAAHLPAAGAHTRRGGNRDPSPRAAKRALQDGAVRQIADAVLYEGYLLWPYRKSAMKNRQRFTFGGIYPPAFDDRSTMRAQALLEADAPRVEVLVRFLHVVRRQVLVPRGEGGVPSEPVEELRSNGRRWISWEEAVEREVTQGAIEIPGGEHTEPIRGGAIRRRWRALEGKVSLSFHEVRPGLHKICLEVSNTTEWKGSGREDALHQTFCSAHAVLLARSGAWVSCSDPPEALRGDVAALRHSGAWPVLVGEPRDRSTLLVSPIILEDHPRVAPESSGDLFDSAEIDQLLVLSMLAMTDEEREQMRASDPRGREILARTEALGEREIMRLHGRTESKGEEKR